MSDTLTAPPAPELHKGLAGVVVDRTAVSSVDAASNSLLYRGYPVQQLAASCEIEDVAYLLLHGELPTPEQRSAFDAELRAARPLAPGLQHVIDLIPTLCPPDGRRPHRHQRPRRRASPSRAAPPGEHDPADTRRLATRLFGALPAVIAYDQRRRRDLPPVQPRDDLGYSADFLRQVFGREADDRRRPGLRHVDGALRGALVQRVDVHGPRRRVDAERPALVDRRRHRRPQGPAARRRQRGRARAARPGRRRRRCRGRRRLARRRLRPAGEDHGLRAPRLQERRQPGADHGGGAGAASSTGPAPPATPGSTSSPPSTTRWPPGCSSARG